MIWEFISEILLPIVVGCIMVVIIFAVPIGIINLFERANRIRKHSLRRKAERRRELAEHAFQCQYKLARDIWRLEAKKADRQTVILKGCFATPEGAEAIKNGIKNKADDLKIAGGGGK